MAGALAGLVLAVSALAASDPASLQTRHGSIRGTISRIDAPALRLHLRSDTGRQMYFAVANVDAMRAVRAGDQVSVDVDDKGMVLNINKAILPPRPIAYTRG